MKHIERRAAPEPAPSFLPGRHPVLRRVLAARAVEGERDLDHSLAHLLPPDGLLDLDRAAALLDDAIESSARIVVAGDYDADGATGCAVAVRGLRMLGAADVRFVVPDRRRHGYGLTPELVDLAHAHRPRLVVTVDNGISSVEGVAHAKRLGIDVLITDHHLPGAELPAADAIVNPNRRGDRFPSKCLAGVGVMFYVLVALRARRRERARGGETPGLAALLDLVALGTVADVVPLDRNNRILVEQGLRRIRAGRASPGVAALLRVARRDVGRTVAADLGYAAAPRLNAAGRLTDMRRGIECLLSEREDEAMRIAGELDALNAQRREIEAGMQAQAEALLDGMGLAGAGETGVAGGPGDPGGSGGSGGTSGSGGSGGTGGSGGAGDSSDAGGPGGPGHPGGPGSAGDSGGAVGAGDSGDSGPAAAISLFRADWHVGVVGILASRVKDRLHRPVAVFAPDADGGCLKGSVRSIPGVHVRDLLDTVATRNPGIIERFGGHAMAAGLTIRREMFDRFRAAFAEEADRVIPAEMRRAVVLTDGEIPGPDLVGLDLARSIRDAAPWGQGFPEPVFDGVFRVARERLVGGRHAKLELLPRGAGERPGSAEQPLDAIAFNREPPIVTNADGEVRMAYRLVVNAFRGEERPELVVEEIGAAP